MVATIWKRTRNFILMLGASILLSWWILASSGVEFVSMDEFRKNATTATSSAEVDANAQRLAGKSTVLSESAAKTGKGDRGTITELQFTRADGTAMICFRLHVDDLRGPAGALDCPEWAQPTLEPKTKEHTKP